jgi:hypothetical protein
MKPKKEKISEQIKIVVNDEKVTYQELKTLLQR